MLAALAAGALLVSYGGWLALRARRAHFPPWLRDLHVNRSAVERRTATLPGRRSIKKEWQAAWLLRAITCIDLTTLSGDDTPGRVKRLCAKARQPVRADMLARMGLDGEKITVGAVCVYPNRVHEAVEALRVEKLFFGNTAAQLARVKERVVGRILVIRLADLQRALQRGLHLEVKPAFEWVHACAADSTAAHPAFALTGKAAGA